MAFAAGSRRQRIFCVNEDSQAAIQSLFELGMEINI